MAPPPQLMARITTLEERPIAAFHSALSRLAFVMVLSMWMVRPSAAQVDTLQQEVGASEVVLNMEFLIGTWNVTEKIYPGTDREYIETSVRVCTSALMNTYVLCKTLASGRGRQREYWFLVNQPEGGTSIEFIGVGTNYSGKSLYRGEFLADGSGIDLRSYEMEQNALTAGTYQRLRFRSADEFEWTIGITNPGTPEESAIGIEHAVRVSPNSPPI